MTQNTVTLICAGIGAVTIGGVVKFVASEKRKLEVEKEKNRHEESMPDSYWEAKKAESEASITIKKLDNEKEIEILKLKHEQELKIKELNIAAEKEKLEAEKSMPEGYFKTKEAEINKKKEEEIAKIKAESDLKIEKERSEAEIKKEKERNRSNENLAREARNAINAIRNFA